MIYDEPVYRPLGDCYVGVELGDEADLRLSFQIVALRNLLEDAQIPGIVEVQTTVRQLAVVLDRTRITHAKAEDALKELMPQAMATEHLASRRVVLPVWYDDPWSDAVAKRFDVPNNLEFLADVNQLTKDGVVERHTSTDHWIAIISFAPGCPTMYPLDLDKRLSAPKYVVPRTYTPARAVVVAGSSTAIHPVASPGGYQLIGRLAVDIYDPSSPNSAFPDDGVLLRSGDRIRYEAVGPLEYEEVREKARKGTYEYKITEDLFDVNAYQRGRAETKGEETHG